MNRFEEEWNNVFLKVIVLLKKCLFLSKKDVLPKYYDLDALAGTWSEEDVKIFYQNIQPFEKVDNDS